MSAPRGEAPATTRVKARAEGRRTSLALVTALVALQACSPPDRPVGQAPALPEAFLEAVRPDTSRIVHLGPDVVYRYLWSPVGPWAIHLLEADLSSCRLGFAVLRAPGSPGAGDSRSLVSRLVALAPPGTVAAVNGDFFTPEGIPQGHEMSTRGLRPAGDRPVFSWTPGHGPAIGMARLAEEGLRIEGEAAGEPRFVISGFPELLDGGRRVGDREVDARPSFAGVRHPRTAVGFSPEVGRLWILVVEGRLGRRSQGMTLPELTDLLSALGVTEALNLDGGGSSVMVLGTERVSVTPEEERPVANALVVRSHPPLCDAGRVG